MVTSDNHVCHIRPGIAVYVADIPYYSSGLPVVIELFLIEYVEQVVCCVESEYCVEYAGVCFREVYPC